MIRLVPLALLASAATALAQGTRPVVPANPKDRPIHLEGVVPVQWRLLSQENVRSEITLTAAQKSFFELLDSGNLPAVVEAASLYRIRPQTVRDLIPAARESFLADTLTKEQRTRLRQIEYQLKEREFGAHAALAMVARELGLRAEQMEDVTSIKGERVEAIAKLVISGDRFDKVKPKVVSTNTDTYEKIAEMLTKAQRERLKELKGKAFAGAIDRKPEVKKPVDLPAFKYPAALFGSYDFEIRYLETGSMWIELGINADQQKLIGRELEGWESEYSKIRDGGLDKVAGLHERTAKALDTILTPRQRTRFDEIMARRRLNAGGPEAACGYPAVVSALKITPIQLKALQEGKSVADVLSKADADKLETLLGKETKLSSLIIDPVMEKMREVQRKRDDVLAAARTNEYRAFARSFLLISDRLKLSEEQIKKLRELAEDEPKFFDLIQRELGFADTPPVAGSGRSITPAGIVSEQFREAMEAQCWNVLDDKQQSTAKAIYGRRK